jgi:hypothetical protein
MTGTSPQPDPLPRWAPATPATLARVRDALLRLPSDGPPWQPPPSPAPSTTQGNLHDRPAAPARP